MQKIIHRIFFNFDNAADPFLPYLETWKEQLPDFEIMQWDKTNLPLDLNAYTHYMAETKNHAFLSDYFRCWLLKKYGGVYLDADIEILDGGIFRKIYEEAQTAEDYDLFIGIESNDGGGLTPHSMGIKCGEFNKLLRFLMNLYETVFTTELRYFIKKFPIPDLMSLYFMNLEKQSQYGVTQNGLFHNITEPFVSNAIKIYPQDYFSPVTTYNGDMMISAFSQNTCLCHHFAATWTENTNNTTGKYFSDLLANNLYVIDPVLIPEIKKRYSLPESLRKPSWALGKNEIFELERTLNKLFPFGGIGYSLLRKFRKK